MSGIIGHLTTVKKGASTLGNVVDFELPAETLIEVDSTTLNSSIKEFTPSTLLDASEFKFTVKLDPTAAKPTKGVIEAWEIQLPKYNPASAAGAKVTFSGFIKGFDAISGSATQAEAMRYAVTVRLTTAPALVLEA